MPLLQLMAERFNAIFAREHITSLDPGLFSGDVSVVQVFSALAIAQTPTETAFLGRWPLSMQRAMLAVLRTAREATPPTPVTMAWAPGYDFEVTIWDARSTPTSAAAITMLVRSRYPDDLPASLTHAPQA